MASRKTKTLRERVDEKWVEDAETGCWQWVATIDVYGYGQIGFDGKVIRAHRAAYIAYVGPIPEGLTIDHLCRNRRCVNPAHLEAVSHRENVLRGTSPLARNAAKTHCKHGHEFTPENTDVRKRGGRDCKTCRRKRQLSYYYARRAVAS